MECLSCQCEITDNANFCPQCGEKVGNGNDLERRCVDDVHDCEISISRGLGSRAYIQKNFDSRLDEWKQAASMGLPEAQWLLARCYEEGLGVQMSLAEALSWHFKAAEQGYSKSQNRIASCYQNGEGVPQDDAEAVRWYRKAAEQGNVIAQANLGWCYDAGSGVMRNSSEAMKWFRLAADQGDYTAQFNLGVHYQKGEGVKRDNEEAVNWYRLAADQGYEEASEALNKLQEDVKVEHHRKAERAKSNEQQYRQACRDAMADLKVTSEEKQQLRTLTESLDMDPADAARIYTEEKKIFVKNQRARRIKDAVLKFRIACKNALSDGKVTVDEKKGLKLLAKSLKLSAESTKVLFENEKKIFLRSRKARMNKNVKFQFRRACKKMLERGKVTAENEQELKDLAKFFKIPNDLLKKLLADEVKIYQGSREKQ